MQQQFEFGVCRVQGTRDHQEDEYACVPSFADGGAFFGVYDGHGSDEYSAHAAKHLHNILQRNTSFQRGDMRTAMVDTFAEEDQRLLKEIKHGHGGSTATVAVIRQNQLCVTNVGDSRAVIAVRKPDGKLEARRVSRDHKPTDADERQRIEQHGGVVLGDRVVDGAHAINLSRALGDYDFKTPHNHASGDHISRVPHVSPLINLDSSVQFCVLASDGLWNRFSDQEVVDLVAALLEKRCSCTEICERLTRQAERSQAADNTTMILVTFHRPGEGNNGNKQQHCQISAPGAHHVTPSN